MATPLAATTRGGRCFMSSQMTTRGVAFHFIMCCLLISCLIASYCIFVTDHNLYWYCPRES